MCKSVMMRIITDYSYLFKTKQKIKYKNNIKAFPCLLIFPYFLFNSETCNIGVENSELIHETCLPINVIISKPEKVTRSKFNKLSDSHNYFFCLDVLVRQHVK